MLWDRGSSPGARGRNLRTEKKEVIRLFTDVWLSGLFVILSIAVFIFLCFKNVHTGIAALISALIAALGSTNSFYTSIFEVFPSGVASLVQMMFFVFTISGLLGFLMDETGCSRSVGNTMVKLLGKDRAWMAISATSIILMLAGVGTFIFVVVVIAAPPDAVRQPAP